MKKGYSVLTLLILMCCLFIGGCQRNIAGDMKESNKCDYKNCECNKEYQKDDNKVDLSNNEDLSDEFTPVTLMDLFDGKRRVWLYIDYSDSRKGLAYDNDVKAVIVTENKKVSGCYYNLIGNINKWDAGSVNIVEANPLGVERFLLSDFSGLSDDEIIDKVSEVYGDATKTYSFLYEGDYYSFEGCTFPYAIWYEGDLDSSGNNLKNEELYFLEYSYTVYFTLNGNPNGEQMENSFEYASIISPSLIKDKEYVGIKDSRGNMLITINDYAAFDSIEYDSPDINKGYQP